MTMKATVLGALFLLSSAPKALASDIDRYLAPNKNLPATDYQMLLVDSRVEAYCLVEPDGAGSWREFDVLPKRNNLQGEYRGFNPYQANYRCDEETDVLFARRRSVQGVEYYYFESKVEPGFCVPQGSTISSVQTVRPCAGVVARTEEAIVDFLEAKQTGESLVELKVLDGRKHSQVAADGRLPIGIRYASRWNLAVRYKRVFLQNNRGEQVQFDLSSEYEVSGLVKRYLTLPAGFVSPGDSLTLRLQVDFIDDTTQVLDYPEPIRVTR